MQEYALCRGDYVGGSWRFVSELRPSPFLQRSRVASSSPLPPASWRGEREPRLTSGMLGVGARGMRVLGLCCLRLGD